VHNVPLTLLALTLQAVRRPGAAWTRRRWRRACAPRRSRWPPSWPARATCPRCACCAARRAGAPVYRGALPRPSGHSTLVTTYIITPSAALLAPTPGASGWPPPCGRHSLEHVVREEPHCLSLSQYGEASRLCGRDGLLLRVGSCCRCCLAPRLSGSAPAVGIGHRRLERLETRRPAQAPVPRGARRRGRGRTFGTDDASVAALVVALFPRFPMSPTDQRCHLQAHSPLPQP